MRPQLCGAKSRAPQPEVRRSGYGPREPASWQNAVLHSARSRLVGGPDGYRRLDAGTTRGLRCRRTCSRRARHRQPDHRRRDVHVEQPSHALHGSDRAGHSSVQHGIDVGFHSSRPTPSSTLHSSGSKASSVGLSALRALSDLRYRTLDGQLRPFDREQTRTRVQRGDEVFAGSLPSGRRWLHTASDFVSLPPLLVDDVVPVNTPGRLGASTDEMLKRALRRCWPRCGQFG